MRTELFITHKGMLSSDEVMAYCLNAPHECSEPKCPGNVNRRKLKLFDRLVKACTIGWRRTEQTPGKQAGQQAETMKTLIAEVEELTKLRKED